MSNRQLTLLAFMTFVATGLCHADTLYFNGFESGTGDWSSTPPGSITQTASGGGPLSLTAYSGSYYGTIQADPDGYLPGYADGSFSLFGSTSTPPAAYPGSAFTQQVAVYINVNTPAPTDPSTPAFWIDTSPSSTSPSDAAYGGLGYGGEENFRLNYTGSQVVVYPNGSTTPLATISSSGWYTFQTVYAMGANPTDLATATMNVIAPDGTTVLGTTTVPTDSDGDPLENQYLGGPGYEWISVWQNGFSNDELGIDNLEADSLSSAATPEPSSILLLGSGMVMAAGAARRRLCR